MRERRPAPDGYPSGPAAALAAHEPLTGLDDVRSIVLVEGVSDRIAVESLARRRGIDLAERRVVVAVLGGVQGMRRMLQLMPRQPGLVLCGLYDEAEEDIVRAALVDQRIAGPEDTPEDVGFFACHRDLEDELIRACGVTAVEERLAAEGDLPAFRTLQQQPEWRDRTPDAQLRRWIASGARRKLRYAQILVDAVDDDRMPRPLVRVLECATEPWSLRRS